MEIKEGMMINGRKVVRVLRWRIHYDTKTKKACGFPSPTTGHLICVADDETKGSQLPLLRNKPHWIEDRDSIMVIFAPQKEVKPNEHKS